MRSFPDFAKELKRPFQIDERCYDCVELYSNCSARPESPSTRCADYFRIPDVGVKGKTGQEIPPSRMGDRKEPRVRSATGAPVRAQVQPKNPPARRRAQARSEPEPIEQDPPESSRQTAPELDPDTPPAIDVPPRDPPASQTQEKTRQQSPAGNPGPDGKRLCGCGAVLPKRKRCCEACRLQRREATMRRRRERPSAAVYDVSDVPLPAAGTLST